MNDLILILALTNILFVKVVATVITLAYLNAKEDSKKELTTPDIPPSLFSTAGTDPFPSPAVEAALNRMARARVHAASSSLRSGFGRGVDRSDASQSSPTEAEHISDGASNVVSLSEYKSKKAYQNWLKGS